VAARMAATSHLQNAAARLNLAIPGRDALTGAASLSTLINE
jgi:GntR family transcriptional repressor for pyruvate dehydrogenase complex